MCVKLVQSELQVHPMKFMTTRCSTMLAKMKSANARSGLMLNWLWFLGLLWIRKQTAWDRTNIEMVKKYINTIDHNYIVWHY